MRSFSGLQSVVPERGDRIHACRAQSGHRGRDALAATMTSALAA